MDAIALFPEEAKLKLVNMSEPTVSQPDEVKLKVLQVGICGTDREEASGGRADAPVGEDKLIIGHEMIGQVVEVGASVSSVKPGDYAIFTVRRGCNVCQACSYDRPDMCLTGLYKERGIKELHGYQTEFVIDKECYLIKVPKAIASFAVLTEPMSVVEKAIDEVTKIQMARIPELAKSEDWLDGKKILVAGLGPIGLLAALALRLRRAEVLGLDILDENSARPMLLKQMGGEYVDGRKVPASNIEEHFGQIDVIVEATGIASLDFDLLSALGVNGVYVLTGIPGGQRPVSLNAASVIDKLVLKNQVMLGSVNASERHFQLAVRDLDQGNKQWPGLIPKFITSRVQRANMQDVLTHHPSDEIKTVIEWSSIN